MSIRPKETFRAVVPGSVYPQTFTPDDDLELASEAAKAALDLELLDKKDAEAVRKARAAAEKKAKAAAPENKGTAES